MVGLYPPLYLPASAAALPTHTLHAFCDMCDVVTTSCFLLHKHNAHIPKFLSARVFDDFCIYVLRDRFRVHTPDADIDVLCLAPRHCSREAFFTSFCDILRNHAEVDELFPVPEAYTPVSFEVWIGLDWVAWILCWDSFFFFLWGGLSGCRSALQCR